MLPIDFLVTYSVLLQHWLRGLCKKGDQCEFLHEFDMSKMPECYFYSRFSEYHEVPCAMKYHEVP